jgi:DNA-binding PucR family transcriptional regulator
MCALVSDPDGPGQRGAIEQALDGVGARAGLGSTVDWSQARVSFARAQAALELTERDGELVAARERAGELLLRSDPGLADELAVDRLAPLADLSPGSRRRLRETLAVWLAEQGRLTSVAERLGIHPQTARYRVGRLRELFGAALDDPDERFWLEVALRLGDGAPTHRSAAARSG